MSGEVKGSVRSLKLVFMEHPNRPAQQMTVRSTAPNSEQVSAQLLACCREDRQCRQVRIYS